MDSDGESGGVTVLVSESSSFPSGPPCRNSRKLSLTVLGIVNGALSTVLFVISFARSLVRSLARSSIGLVCTEAVEEEEEEDPEKGVGSGGGVEVPRSEQTGPAMLKKKEDKGEPVD